MNINAISAELMKYLHKTYGSEEVQGVDLLWNPTNHRVLDKNDFIALREKYAVHPWEFIQRAVSLPLIHPYPQLICLCTETLPYISAATFALSAGKYALASVSRAKIQLET